MGLLDEAIREHLELKRRRGADPGEVARQEREILGPITSGSEPAPAPAPLAPLTDDDDLAALGHEPHADAERDEPVVFDDEGDEDEVWDDATTQVVERTPPSPPESTAEFSVADLEDEPAGTKDAEEDDLPFFDDEPDIVPADEEPEGEDILDQTPEFLEETPEHDRLWFEQRPPRDFDFGN